MEENNKNINLNKIIKGQSYPGVLEDVVPEYDYIRKVYVVKFFYKVYLSPSQTEEVEDYFYMWDKQKYRRFTFERLNKMLDAYNLKLISKDYRNEITIANACKWLVGTKVEIKQYRYKGARYKVVSTERNDEYRINCLWECMLRNDLHGFQIFFCNNLENDLLDPQMYYKMEFDVRRRYL